MDRTIEPPPGEKNFDTLVKWLNSKDPQKRLVATTVLCRVGKPTAPLLVFEAIKPGKRSQHRIALLDVVQQIGGPLGPEQLFSLRDLPRHRDPAVCR